MNWEEFFNKETFSEAELSEAHVQAEADMLKAREEADKYPTWERPDLHHAYQHSIEVMGTINQMQVYPHLAHKFLERIKGKM